ncbi:MAG: hypothetical protein Q4C95_05310 [Planctomycetia bacterium]|nr:hypothetical protein [Planctomycetia bacterium]
MKLEIFAQRRGGAAETQDALFLEPPISSLFKSFLKTAVPFEKDSFPLKKIRFR